jgi:hypothetical protein
MAFSSATWRYRLSPDDLNRNLVHAGLVLVAVELVRKLVVNRVKAFYDGVTFGEGLPFKDYEQDVLSRDKHVFEASLLYLRDNFEAISADDLDAIQALRKHRNRIAHDLPSMLPKMDRVESENIIAEARQSLFRLSNFWTYIEVGSDPEFASQDIDWEAVAGEDLTLLDEIIEQARRVRTGQDAAQPAQRPA